jgi:hypothetical protein
MRGYYEVMVIDDHLHADGVADAFAIDRERRGPDRPYLKLWADTVLKSRDDAREAIWDLRGKMPPAILLDDYLDSEAGNSPAALELMSLICAECISLQIDSGLGTYDSWPRVTLSTGGFEPQLAYTFTALGGMQVVDKKLFDMPTHVPVDAIWRSLAGERWQPDPYPPGWSSKDGFADPKHAIALPWLEAGWDRKLIMLERPVIASGVTLKGIEAMLDMIRRMPRTEGYPTNLNMAVNDAKANGWVWVPLKWHRFLPQAKAPLGLVIDPGVHRSPLSAMAPTLP